ncbi:MAG TPA: hypothetical protein DG942_02325, partial [Ruminococcaceae bacterium]|nr:hypothetical protein [Oscillospiraceae bacterium]
AGTVGTADMQASGSMPAIVPVCRMASCMELYRSGHKSNSKEIPPYGLIVFQETVCFSAFILCRRAN